MPLSSSVEEQAQILLQVTALTKRYGDQVALADIALTVRAGEILGLIGPNGAGKTTLLEALAGILPADSADLRWRGAPLPPARRRDVIFYVPDGMRPYDDQPVARVLAFFAGVYQRSTAHIADYSRRLMLAVGLLTPQPLLLMDEPFDGFDLKQTREIMGVLRRLATEGRTLVLAIHQLLDAERVCDRFVLLADGRVRGAGTLGDLRTCTHLSAGSLEEVFLALT